MQIGKDIERYDWYYNRELISEIIIDRQNKEEYCNATRICKLLNQQDQRIAELEEQLKNAIVPKFKIGQEVWYVWNKSQVIPFKCKIEKIVYDSSKNYKLKYDSEHYICMQEQHLFATKEEAQAKLQELQGESL